MDDLIKELDNAKEQFNSLIFMLPEDDVKKVQEDELSSCENTIIISNYNSSQENKDRLVNLIVDTLRTLGESLWGDSVGFPFNLARHIYVLINTYDAIKLSNIVSYVRTKIKLGAKVKDIDVSIAESKFISHFHQIDNFEQIQNNITQHNYG